MAPKENKLYAFYKSLGRIVFVSYSLVQQFRTQQHDALKAIVAKIKNSNLTSIASMLPYAFLWIVNPSKRAQRAK